VKKGGRKDVDMAIPKTCSNDKAFAVNYSRRERAFGRRTKPHGKNMIVMDETDPFSIVGSAGEG